MGRRNPDAVFNWYGYADAVLTGTGCIRSDGYSHVLVGVSTLKITALSLLRVVPILLLTWSSSGPLE